MSQGWVHTCTQECRACQSRQRAWRNFFALLFGPLLVVVGIMGIVITSGEVNLFEEIDWDD